MRNFYFLLILSLSAFVLQGSDAVAQCSCAGADFGNINVAGWTVNSTATQGSVWGGERVTISNTVAGAVYRISTCGASYDSQLSIYTTGCSYIAYNDDNGPACTGTRASVQFTSPGGNLFAKLNQYNCATNSTSTNVIVTLVSLPCNAVDDGSITANGAYGSINVCLGSTVTIASVGGNTSNWCYWISSNGGASWNMEAASRCNQGSFSYTPNAVGSWVFHKRHSDNCGYCWDAGRSCGCSNCTVTVNVQAPPSAPTGITGVTTVCSGSSTTLTANGGDNGSGAVYQWGTGTTVGSNVIAGATGVSYTTPALTSSTTYWVRRVGNTSCTTVTGGVTQQVIVNPVSVAPSSISATATSLCGGSTTLTANGGLIAYYPFSSNLNDASGSGLHLTGSGGTFAGGGLDLTTASSYTSAATAALNTDRYTISFDMMFTANPDGSWRKIFGFNSGGSDRSPGIWKFPSSMNMHWRHDPGNTGIDESYIYNLNQWYNVVGEKNGATFTLYVNGVQVAQGTVANPKSAGLAALWFGGAPVRLKEFKVYNGILRWFSGSCGGTAVGNGPSVTVTPPLGVTNYFVRVEGSCNTTGCTSVGITRVAAPTASAGGNISQCGTTAYTVTGASAGGTYSAVSWAASGLTGTGSITAGASTLNPTFTPTSPTGSVTLTMTVTGSGACAGNNPTSSMTFTWTSAPSVQAGPATINQCGTANVMFTGASASTPGTWTWSLLAGGTGTGNLINGGASITAWGFQPTSQSGSRTVRLSNTGSGGCGTTTVTDDIVISWAQTPSVTATSPQNSCAGSSPIVINGVTPGGSYGNLSWALTASNGSGSITSNGTTSSPTFTPTTTTGQYTFTVTVFGNSHCTGTNATASKVVNWAPAPSITSVGANAVTCGTAPHPMTGATVSGTFGSVAWTGGAGTWSNTSTTNPAAWTFTPSSATAGSFNATLTVFGSGTCAGTNATSTARVVSWSTPPAANAGATINSCTNTGAIAMTGATSSNGTYAWSTVSGSSGTWNQGASTAAATFTPAASPGTSLVRLTVTGTGGCSATQATSTRTINWFTPPVISSVVSSNLTDCNNPNGIIVINATGVGSLQYSVNNGTNYFTTSTFDPLAAGSYNIRVRDANNCVTAHSSNPVVLTLPAAVTASSVTVSQNVTCGGGNNGSITITGISGGSPNYEYTLSGPTSDRWDPITTLPNFTISNLPAGTYQVVIRDKFGCMSSTFTRTITQPTPINITAVNVTDIAGCGGSGTGAISVTASGGTGALNYYRNNVINSPATSGSWTGLSAGLYEIEVRDANGCSQMANARISAPWVPTAGNNIQICSGQSVQLQGGIIGQFPTSCEQTCTSSCAAPTSYCAVSASNTTDEWISGVVFSGISNSGNPSTNYTNNTATATLVYRNSTYPLTVTVSQCGGCAYTEYVSAFFDWNRNGVFEAGEVYNIGATSGNPGSVTQNITIPAGALLGTTRMRIYMNFASFPDPSGCLSTTFGEIEDYSIEIRGNQPCVPTVSWSHGLGSSYTPTVAPTANTTYTLTINDGAGCTQTSNINVIVSNPVITSIQENVSCSGANDACIILASQSGGVRPYLEKLSNGQFMVLGGQRRAITVNSAAALTNHQVNVSIPYASPMRSDFGDIRFFDNNLTPIPYWVESYALSGTANVWLKIPSLAAGANTIQLVYGNSSLTTASNGNAVFEFFDDFDSFNGSKWSQLNVTTVPAGATPWLYQGGRLRGGNNHQYMRSVPSLTGNLIQEARIFEATAIPNGFTTSGFWSSTGDNLTILSHDGNSYASNNGGNWVGPTAYTSAGQWVRDRIVGTGASSSATRTRESDNGTISFAVGNSGISNEGVYLGARSDHGIWGLQNYSAQWDWIFVRKHATSQPTATVGPVETSNESFCGLAPGAYTINMVDAAGCARSQNFTITEPAALTVTQNNYSVICPGASNGSIDINVTGGTPTYSYLWAGPSSFSATTQDISSRPSGAYNVTTADNNGCTETRTYSIYNYPALPAVPTPSASASSVCSGGTVTLSANGLAPGGQVANFAGTQTTSSTLLTAAPNNFTMELWVNPTATRAVIGESTSGTGGTSNQRYAIFSAHGSANAGAGISVGTNGISVLEHGDGYLPALLEWNAPLSGWTHVAVVYTNKTPSLYVNGNLVKTGLTSLRPNVYPSVGTGSSYGYYAGALDNVRIWSTSRTLAQIQADMYREDPTVATGLIAHYKYTGNTNASVGANLTNGGATFTNANHFTYTWSGTGAPAASTSQTQTTATLSTGTTPTTINYTVTATANGCAGTTSAAVPVTVNPRPTMTSTSAITICSGTSPNITLTATPASTFSWTLGAMTGSISGAAAGSGGSINQTLINLGTSNASIQYLVTPTATSGSCPATSPQTVTVTVRPPFIRGEIASAGETICYGGNPSLIGNVTSASGGDGLITYEWRANGVVIAGATGATYDPPAGLTTTTIYTRHAKDGTCNAAFTQSVGSWQVIVNPQLTAGSIGTSQSICYNATPPALTETGAATGGTGSYTYQWQSSSNGTTWNNIGGATSATFAPGNLTATTHYRRNVTSGTCGTLSSNVVIVTVLDAVSSLTTGNNGPVCTGSPLTLSVGTVTGATYQWSGPNGFSSTDQNPTVSAAATSAMGGTYSVTAYVSGCPSPTGTTTVSVVAQPAITLTGTNQSICSGANAAAFTASLSGGSGCSIQWQSSSNGTAWTNVGTGTSFTPTGLTNSTFFRAVSTGCVSGCVQAISQTRFVAVSTAPTVQTHPLPANQSVCLGSNVAYSAQANLGSGTTRYRLVLTSAHGSGWHGLQEIRGYNAAGAEQALSCISASSATYTDNVCGAAAYGASNAFDAAYPVGGTPTSTAQWLTPEHSSATAVNGTSHTLPNANWQNSGTFNPFYAPEWIEWSSPQPLSEIWVYNGRLDNSSPSTCFKDYYILVSYDSGTTWHKVREGAMTNGYGLDGGNNVFNIQPTYTWKRGTTIVGTGNTLNVNNVGAGDAGTYTVEMTYGCGTATSNQAVLSITSNNTASVVSASSTCVNAPMASITQTTTGATGIGAATGLPAGVNASWAANVITISGTPTAAGTFNYSIPLTGGCGAVNATGTIVVTPANTAGAPSSTPTVCISTPLTAITHTTSGATGIGVAVGLPAGVSAGWAANTITISGTPTASGTFNYTIPLTGGCGAVNATGTITVTANKTASIASATPTLCISTPLSAITHTTTGATGISNSGVSGANGLPAGVSAAWAANTITITGTPTASGTFNYSIPLTGGCGTVNATGTITVTPNKTASAPSSTPTVCINTALPASITHTTTGAVGIGVATGLPAGVSASWASNTISISGTPTASGTFNYSIPLSGGCGTVNATGTITVTPSVSASVSIVASANTICPGTNVTFTATPTNGGAAPSYQWKVGSTNVGTNSPTFSSTSLVNGNVVTVVMTSNAACPTGSPATSNGITISVISPATPVASVTAQPTCLTAGGTIAISSPIGASYEYALNGGTYQSSPTFTGLAAGNYSATVRLAASPTCVSPSGPSLTINTTPSAIPPMTPVIVCQGSSGFLVSNNNCVDNFVAPFPANTIYNGWLASGSPTAAIPSGAVNSNVCAFGGPVRTYSIVPFQVSITGNYIFEMNANAAYNGAAYIFTGNFTPGSCATGTLVRADNASGTDGEPRLGGAGGAGNMTLTAGVTYTLVSTTDGGADVTGNTYTWTVTPPAGGDVLLNTPGSVQWYTASAGGSPIYTGETFNPVGVAGSGLVNTNTQGTWTYYAACSSSPSCRTAATFQVTSNTTIYNVSPTTSTCYNPSVPVTVSLSGSVNGMPYRLMRDGVATGTQVTGTGGAITIGNTSTAGVYTVVAVLSESCLVPMNGVVDIKPAPIANAGADVTLCGSSIGLTGSSNGTTLATENFGSANSELTNSSSGWRVHYLYGTHPANRTRWYISHSGAAPFNFSCASTGSALVMVDDLLPFQAAVPCDYAWDNGIMDEIAYNTAPIDARLYTSVNVSFTYRIGGNYSAARNPQVTDYMQVMYSLDNGLTWVAVNAGNNGGSYTLRSALNGTTNAFFSLTGTTQTGTANVSLPAAVAGNRFLLGFRWTNDGSMTGDYVDNMLVDNIVVTGAASYSWSPTTGVTNANTATPTVTVPTTYTVTVTGGNGCSATDDVIVRPRPQVNTMTGTTICSGATFTVNPVNGTNGVVPAGTTYSWAAPSVAGITGTTAGNNATSITGAPVNTTNAAINVTYVVTPTGNGCTSTPFNVTVTVNPRPAVTNMTASICSGATFTATPANSTNGIVPAGTTYSWSVPVVTGGITGGSIGSGASISGTLVNPTSTPQTATYTVTASTPSCAASGTFTVVVTVNPTPAVTNMTVSACSGVAFSVTPVQGTNGTVPAGTIYSWSTAPTVTGGMTGGATGSGASSIGGTLVNPTTSNQTATYSVTPSVSGCSGTPFSVVATINPSVTVPGVITVSGTEPACQLTSAGSTTDYNSSITVGTQQWSLTGITNTNGTITTGAINSSNGVVTWPNGWSGSVTVNVVSTGCNGPSAAATRTVTVLPTVGSATAPTVVSGTEPLCQLTNGTTTTGYGSTASNNTGFNWSISNPAAGSINSTTGVMTWANGFSGSVNIQVTANGCSGPSAQAIRTVNIGPSVTVPTAITFTGTEPSCQLTAGSTTDYNSTASVGTLQWSLTGITNSSGTLLASAINATTGVVSWPNGWSGSVTIRVVSNGCNGPSTAVTRLVNVTPTVATPSVPAIISGSEPPCQLTNGTTTTGYGATAANSTGFNWSISNPAAGSINPTTGVMTWANGFAGSVNIQVTANGCNSPSAQVVRPVTVSPTVGTPTAIAVSAGTEPICQLMNGTTTTTYSSSATSSTALNWSISNPAAGSINSSGVLTWTNGFYGTVDIRVTASGCNGPSAQVIRTVNVGIGVLNNGFRTWTGLVNTLWEVPGNWDCGGVPTSADRVIIPAVPIGGNEPHIKNGIIGYCLDIELQGSTIDLLEIEDGGLLNVGP